MVSAAGIRRPIVAGLVVGCIIAFFHNHFDDMRLSHDENPFAHHNNGGHLGNHWERRAFASEHAVIKEEKAVAARSTSAVAANTDIVVEVPREDAAGGGKGGGGGGGAAGAAGAGAGAGARTAGASAAGAAVAPSKVASSSAAVALPSAGAIKPLQLTYPDPFKVFKGCKPEPLQGGAPRRLDLVADPAAAEWPVDCGGHESLCEILRDVAVNREVLAAVANINAPVGLHSLSGGVRLVLHGACWLSYWPSYWLSSVGCVLTAKSHE